MPRKYWRTPSDTQKPGLNRLLANLKIASFVVGGRATTIYCGAILLQESRMLFLNRHGHTVAEYDTIGMLPGYTTTPVPESDKNSAGWQLQWLSGFILMVTRSSVAKKPLFEREFASQDAALAVVPDLTESYRPAIF